MSLTISPHTLPSLPSPSSPASGSAGGGSFRSILEGAINHAEQSRATAGEMVNKFLSGEGQELHSVALASQRADLEFNLLLQIRNKVVSAYQEVMKMQV
jgi:flagellar hook-basal body complex protein FliE